MMKIIFIKNYLLILVITLLNACSATTFTDLFMDLEYYNTLSSRYILNILKLISRINSLEGKEAKIFWYFDEEDYGIRDDIKMFSELIDHKIHEIEYELA